MIRNIVSIEEIDLSLRDFARNECYEMEGLCVSEDGIVILNNRCDDGFPVYILYDKDTTLFEELESASGVESVYESFFIVDAPASVVSKLCEEVAMLFEREISNSCNVSFGCA